MAETKLEWVHFVTRRMSPEDARALGCDVPSDDGPVLVLIEEEVAWRLDAIGVTHG